MRNYGKTLNMNMLERFFSVEYKGQGQVFEGLSIWKDKKYQEIQGTYPVIALSFADVKEVSFHSAREKICQIIKMVFRKYRFLLDSDLLGEDEKADFRRISSDPGNTTITLSLKMLSLYLSRYYGKKDLEKKRFSAYWANTSSNDLVGKLVREGSPELKETMEDLLKGRKFCTEIDEQIVFSQLEYNESAVWSLFLASGYLKADSHRFQEEAGIEEYEDKDYQSALIAEGICEDRIRKYGFGFEAKRVLIGS